MSKIFSLASATLQKITPPLQAGHNPTLRHWAIGWLDTFPTQLAHDLQGASRLKSFSNWTARDLKTAGYLTAQFGAFFLLGEAYGRGDISGYPVYPNPHAHDH